MDRENRERLEAACLLGKQRNALCEVGDDCKKCGWNKDEAERRASLPLEEGADGLRRKDVRHG